MDRTLSTETLIDYHFGTLGPEARAEVEETLLASADSLRAYLRLKRELDRAQPVSEGPSPEARLRLRAAVAELVRPARTPGLPGLRSLLARPVPLYQTLAAAAVAALLVVMAGGLLRQGPVEQASEFGLSAGAASAPAVDFARPSPLSLDVF